MEESIMCKKIFLGFLKIVSLSVVVLVVAFLLACTIQFFKTTEVTTSEEHNEELTKVATTDEEDEEEKASAEAKEKAPAEAKAKAKASAKEVAKAPAEAKPTTISLLCKWDSCEDGSQLREFHERTAYSSIEDARKDSIILGSSEVRITFMLPPELKKVKIHYEELGEFKEVKFDKKNRTATIERLATDGMPKQTIVHIQCTLGSFFLYIDTEERPFNPGSGSYVAGINMDYHETEMDLNPIQFGDSLTKSEFKVARGLAQWGINLVFYFDKKVSVTVFDEQRNKFIKTHKKNIGNFYVFSVKNVANDVREVESYIITLTIKGQKSKYLRVKSYYEY